MYRRFGLLYTVFSLLVLAALVIIAAVRINSVREFNLQDAQTSFIRLQGRVRTALNDEDADLGDAIRTYAQQVPTTLAVVVYNPDEGFRYVWTSDIGVLGFSRTNLSELRGFPTYELREVSQFKVSGPIDGVPESRLFMDAVYRVLDYGDAYPALRDSLIMLLAFALLTVVIALVSGSLKRSSSRTDDKRAEPDGDTPVMPAPEQATRRAALERAEPERLAPEPPQEQPVLEEVDLEEIATDPGEPGTLFNPVSNLSYRDHLETRLGLELERAAFNDQDLTCMLVRFPDASSDPETHNVRAEQILSAFKFEDLCFEYGSDSFCVIMPNTELSQGIREAESFKSDTSGTIYVGMSARNGRLVDASRVLGEAERSLDHAGRERGGIVGFRPDPKKYRQYVTRQADQSS